MAEKIILDTIQRKVAQLPLHIQRQVLFFVESLSTPHGGAGRNLLPLAGSLPNEDAAAILEVIDTGCEQVDHEW